MPELSAVEYNYNLECYVALLSNGDMVALESKDLRGAEIEAERYLSHNEFTSFTAPGNWE